MQDTLRVLYSDSLQVFLSKPAEEWWQSTEWWALVIAVFAALVALIGSIITYRIATKQLTSQLAIAKEQLQVQSVIAQNEIKASVLSRNRQDWINTLRDNLADVVAISRAFAFKMQSGGMANEEAHQTYHRIESLQYKIELLVNPEEPDHLELIVLLLKLQTLIPDPQADMNAITEKATEITTLSQRILKREWNRVKRLE